MRKLLIFFLFLWPVTGILAQNVQLHYDAGKGRGYLTSTVEMFKPDQYGSTFFFIDMDYGSVPGVKGVSLAYWEIARGLKFWDAPVAFHTEYNGGFGQWSAGDVSGAYQINDAFLNGIEYSVNASDFSKGLTLQAMHKYIQGKHDFAWQLTGVWFVHMAKGKLSFTGFADFWREDMLFGDETTKFVFLTEPQLWYNFNPHFSVGGEVEGALNFAGQKGFKVNPTIGLKYTL